jgi:hypothetical protein
VERGHKLRRRGVVHLPQADEHAGRAGEHEGPAEAPDPLARVDLAEAGLARRQDDQVGPDAEVEHLADVEEAVVGPGGAQGEPG